MAASTEPTPAASIQERMWFAERMEPGTALYNVPLAWRVRGRLAPDALGRALAIVVDRHEILRTSFAERDGRLYQVIGDPWTPEVEHVDLRGTADGGRGLRAWLREAADRPFDTATNRLFRVGLADLEGHEQIFFLCVHHCVWDAATMPLFMRELRACYDIAAAEPAAEPTAELSPTPSSSPSSSMSPSSSSLSPSSPVRSAPLPVMIADQAARTPGRPAVVYEGTAMSYQELERRSGTVAAHLAGRGIGRGDLVGVYLDRSPDLVVALLGVLRAGAAYVPLDPVYPPERISLMLEDAQVGLVLTQERLEADVAGGAWATLCLDRDRARIEAGPHGAPPPVTGDDLAYVIYTSGSTGRPKGVRVTHRGVANLLTSMAERPGFGERDKILAVATISFDMAVPELYLPLIAGGVVEIVPSHVAKDGMLLAELAGGSRPTHMQGTPAMWRMLLDAGWAGDPVLTVLTGGEALTRDLADELVERSAGVWNMYGPTETTVWSTASRVDATGPITIGQAIAGTTLHVLDEGMRPVPAGHPGELWIGGDGVALGYLNRPELTAERFRSGPGDGSVLYRTGDLVRELPDGRLEYINRLDNQIKLRGFRIEPGEIEACLRGHPSVGEAVVLLEGETDPRLVAYLRCPGGPPAQAELRAHLGARLPAYMIPSYYHAVEEFPLTDNGKLDRRAVRGTGTRLSSSAGPPPSTPTGRLLQGLFARLLDVPEPGAEDSFFDLGGHSLLAGRLIKEVAARTGVRLSLRDVFGEPELQKLADHIDALSARRADGGAADRPPELVPAVAGTQYRDFALAEEAARSTPAAAEGLEYWARTLAGAPAFPAMSPPLRCEPHGAVPVGLPDDILDRLRDLRDAHGVSWFVVVATALAALLHRWSGQDDVTFGCPVGTRDAFPDVLGPCLNTVVLRSECTADMSLLELLRAMRETALDALDNTHVPFGDVVDLLNPPRRPGLTPYSEVTLAATSADPGPLAVGGLPLDPYDLNHDGAAHVGKFGLTVNVDEVGGRLRSSIYYRGDRFTKAEVERMADWFGRLLGSFADVADRPVRTLDLVDDAALTEIIGFEHGPPARPPATVPALFARACAEHPTAPAVRTNAGVLTYRELDLRAEAVAAALRPHVRGPDPTVVFTLPRGEDLVVALLAAWKAGYVACPLDPAYPESRVGFILDDLDACAVLTGGPASAAAPSRDGTPVIDITGIGAAAAPAAAGVVPDPDSIAYVLYTSGTTGEPKGVACTHGGLAQVVQWHIETFGMGRGDRVSQIHSVAFDTTQHELWPALCSGAELLPYERPVVAPELAAWLDEQRVTQFFVPTPLAEALWSSGTDLAHLRWMYFAGSPLTRRPPTGTSYRIFDAYGPTETFITTGHVVDPETATVLNCIGRPTAGVRVYVLDGEGRRCPVGVPGEIHVAGATVARGYWRREELTRERFSSRDPDGGPGWVYRTGDRGRWLPDGTLEYLGRSDRQLKIRGYRVEPQEIEAQLRRHPLVREAVVRGFPGEAAALVAYLVARDADREDSQAVLDTLKVHLPEFMVPNAIVWLPELPLNTRGKVDAGRLPRPTRNDLAGRTAFAAPETGVERRIAAVWSGVLGVESVGAHDNFFDLGGNSLLLAKLHSRLQAELDVVLPIRRLFEYPTVHALARLMTSGDGGDERVPSVSGQIRDRAGRARRSRARTARPGRRPGGGNPREPTGDTADD